MALLVEIAAYLNDRLNIESIPDYPNALNGVQVANVGGISRIASAVDFSSVTVGGAIDAGAQLLLVHHGMFWSGAQPITGERYSQLRALITHDLAVYSAHLPLDVHSELGNNALLARHLGLVPSGGFGRYQSLELGLRGECDVPTETLVANAGRLSEEHGGRAISTPFAAGRVTRRWGICTGAGASTATLREAAERGIDTLIVGEGPHHTAVEARDAGIVIIYAGHYATETLGVRALGEEVAASFDLRASFIPAPTGL
jgi:dinuclear metal center YbgI/SA1388 family protein